MTTSTTTQPPLQMLVSKAKARGVTEQQLDAFFRNVRQRDDGCWQWMGTITNNGLPLFADCPPGRPGRLQAKSPMAHRTAFWWFKGRLYRYPYAKLIQTCGHKACVNPMHLQQKLVREAKPVELHTDTLTAIFSRVECVPMPPVDRPDDDELVGHCWRWTGDVNVSGYPTLEMLGHPRSLDVLVFAWFGTYLAGQSEATHLPLHKCEVRACLNPAHMRLVLAAERQAMAGRLRHATTEDVIVTSPVRVGR